MFVAERKLKGTFRYSVFAVIFVEARFGIRPRLDKTVISAFLFTFYAFGLFLVSIFFAVRRRRRRFCFVRHLLNLYDNTHYRYYKRVTTALLFSKTSTPFRGSAGV